MKLKEHIRHLFERGYYKIHKDKFYNTKHLHNKNWGVLAL